MSSSPPRHRPRSRLRTVAFLAAMGVAAGGGILWWRSGAVSATPALLTAAASRAAIEDSITALGTVQPLNYVDVGTQVSGQVRKLPVAIGDTVSEGQLLAELDPTLYESKVAADRAQLLNLRAQRADRQAQLTLAETQFNRQSRMLAANVTSNDSYQSADAALKSAQAQLAQIDAQIQEAESTLSGDQANLSYTRITSPMSGTVVSQSARQGQTLNANQSTPTVLRVADLRTMTVWTQVSEADVGRLSVGMPVYFTTLGQPERRWTGTLRQIQPTPEVTNNVVLYYALFDVENSDGSLGIQMTAQVFFVRSAAEDVLTVPLSALSAARLLPPPSSPPSGPPPSGTSPSGTSQPKAPPPALDANQALVLVMKDGNPTPRRVTIGIRNRVSAQIVEGLSEGEIVVTGLRQPKAANKASASSNKNSGPPPPPM